MEDKTDKRIYLHSPLTWKGNILIFFILFVGLVFYFSYQINRARDVFISDAKSHAKMVSDLINLSVKNSLDSLEVVDEVLGISLLNTTKFIEYLDSVELFNENELEAFAIEAGLSGALIFRDNSSYVSGPQGWIKVNPDICRNFRGLAQLAESGDIFFSQVLNEKGCIIVGLHSGKIISLKKNIGLEATINKFMALPEISYINMEKKDNHNKSQDNPPQEPFQVNITKINNKQVAEVKIDFNNNLLTVGIDASPLEQNTWLLWRDLIIFSVIIVITGSLLSWLIYRQHNLHLKHVGEYERKLSIKREEALIGRAASSIAHEVRNPLNAISIGLQRLKLENSSISNEHAKLIEVMLDSLRRANGIISDLQKYARIPEPRFSPVNIIELIEKNIILYKKIFEENNVKIEFAHEEKKIVMADPDLLSHVFQNLIKNAVEAQPQGGFFSVLIEENADNIILNFGNTGELPHEKDRKNIMEPYFTTKTRGIGLGLAISNRIIRAHGGELNVSFPHDDVIRIAIILPKQESE